MLDIKRIKDCLLYTSARDAQLRRHPAEAELSSRTVGAAAPRAERAVAIIHNSSKDVYKRQV